MRDYYKVLGLSDNASEDQIKSAYRKLSHQYHPDHNPYDQNAHYMFQMINEAYSVLSDPIQKIRLDVDLRTQRMQSNIVTEMSSDESNNVSSIRMVVESFGWNRSLSALLALLYSIILILFADASMIEGSFITMTLLLILIWFGDAIGAHTSNWTNPPITQATPGCFIQFVGWAGLILFVAVGIISIILGDPIFQR